MAEYHTQKPATLAMATETKRGSSPQVSCFRQREDFRGKIAVMTGKAGEGSGGEVETAWG